MTKKVFVKLQAVEIKYETNNRNGNVNEKKAWK